LSSVRFWLLDINDDLIDGAPAVRLWGIDEAGRRVMIYDNFSPHFFLLLNPSENPMSTLAEAGELSKGRKGISSLELGRRKYLGRERDVIRVVCEDQISLTKSAEALSRVKGVEAALEEDIRFSMKYMIERDVWPCSWHEVEVREVPVGLGFRIDRAYVALSPPRRVEDFRRPDLRAMAFSILCPGSRGSPRPPLDPLRGIFAKSDLGEGSFIAKGDRDAQTIEDFSEFVKKSDPDVIVGFGSNGFDWPYLMERARLGGVRLEVGRDGGAPHRSTYGHISITGRAGLDLLDIANGIPEVKQKALANTAEFLGVLKGGEMKEFDEVELAREWGEAGGEGRLRDHFSKRTYVILKCYESLMDFAIALSNITGLPLDQAATAAVGFRVDSLMMRVAHMLGELIPKREERPYSTYKGGLVLHPKPGLHEDVAVLDFKSMYPNLMIIHNISPDTYCPPGEDCGEFFEAPEVGHRFRRDRPGLYGVVLSRLMGEREALRKRLMATPKGDPSHRVLAEREKATKILINACYGYSGWGGARWYSKEVAESAAALGRAAIMGALRMAEEMGLEPIYGDTDSIFLKSDPGKLDELIERIVRETGVEIKIDKIYRRVLFTESKKRYAGLLENGDLDVVGLEVIRGDWSGVARVMQEGVLKRILSEGGPDGAVRFARSYIGEVRSRTGTVPFKDFIIWKSLAKPVEDYRVKAPHVEAAKRLAADGVELSPGDEVGYIITKGRGKIHERAKPYAYATIEEVDAEYYINNQLVPVASRILSMFGVTEGQILGGGKLGV
jgi:DNA polymerase I